MNGTEIFARRAELTWRKADDALYVFDTGSRKAYRIDNAEVREADDTELRSVFGDSDENVIRVCNMI